MIVNVILPVTSNPEKYVEFVKRESASGVRFCVGVREKCVPAFKKTNLKNAEVHVFSDKTDREEMINSLSKAKMKSGKIMVVRRVLNEFEFNSLKNSTTDITTLQPRSKTAYKWIKNIASKVVKKIFAFSFFEDISAICFGETMFELVSSFNNLSSASRLNRYVGLTYSAVETREKPVVKEFHRRKTWTLFALSNLFLVGSFVGGILIFVFCETSVPVSMLIVLWLIVALLVWVLGMIGFARSLVVGDLKVGQGEEFSILKVKQNSKKQTSEDDEEEN